MYVLRRTSDNKYVSEPGRKYSYTNFLENARKFSTKEEAERNRCVENEYIEEVGI